MALLTVVYLWQRWGAPLTGADPWDWVFFPGNSRAWTVATAIFLHGSWLHLLGNLLYLHVLAPPLEERLGRPALLGLVLVLGVGGNLAHGLASALNLFGQGGLGVMGASGAIAGLMALTMLRLYSARVVIAWWLFAPIGGQNKVGRTPVPVLWAVPLWILLQVAQEWLDAATLTRTLRTDGPLAVEWFNPETVALLDAQVWGQGFEAPVFCDEVQVLQQRLVGEKHLKLRLRHGGPRGAERDAIWFSHTEPLPAQVRLAYRISLDEWNGRQRVQMVVEAAG